MRNSRIFAIYYTWALLICPSIGWVLAVIVVRGEGALALFVALFILLPAVLAFAGGRRLRAVQPHFALGLCGAAGVGLLLWVATLIRATSEGVFS